MTIKLDVDIKDLVEGLDNLSFGINELTSPKILDQVSKAVFDITGKRFMVDVDNYARSNPKKMHHVYEWGKVGQPTGRLFVLERSVLFNGTLTIETKFLPSKLPVPVNQAMLASGKTGKSISRRSIFANKAAVMEKGAPVSFQAKRILAFMGNNGVAFVAPGTKINIMHPGGISTRNAFAEYLLDWYIKKAHIVLDSSGLYERIANDVAKVLSSSNAGAIEVERAVSLIANQYGTGSTIK